MRRLVWSCVVIAILGSIVAAQRTSTKPRRLEKLAEEARAVNKDHIDVPVHFEGVMGNLDRALEYYYVMIIQPTMEETVSDENGAYTWFRSTVLETLSTPTRRALPIPSSLDELSPETRPTHLLRLRPAEILIAKKGGMAEVGGVQIRFVNEGFPDFSLEKRYLVFATMSPDGKIANIPLGGQGICELDADVVRSLGSDDSPIVEELNKLSLRSFRDRLSRRHK